jgi:signal peptidase I
MNKRLWPRLWQYRPVLYILCCIAVVRSILVDLYVVPSASMKPTIIEQDRIIVNKLAYFIRLPFTSVVLYRFAPPQRGDIVIADPPHHRARVVKRVIGLPGDTLAIKDNHVFINEMAFEYTPAPAALAKNSWLDHSLNPTVYIEKGHNTAHYMATLPKQSWGYRNFDAITVPEGQYFLMGDNRDNSVDSREMGFVEQDAILGRVSHLFISTSKWSRSFLKIDSLPAD